jgi:hypothetical protein
LVHLRPGNPTLLPWQPMKRRKRGRSSLPAARVVR